MNKEEYAITYPEDYTPELDGNGRYKIDLERPHKLYNMDFFRQAALCHERTGKYTEITFNPHPEGDYKRFWDEEQRRCRDGLVRDDGEWISGYNYFYWNYAPIWLTEDKEEQLDDSQNRRSERTYKFAKVWDSDYQFFHYIEQAEQYGQHACVLKTRGRGYSYKASSMLARNFFHFPGSNSFAFAFEKEFLIKDGLLSKAWDTLDWVDKTTPWSKLRQKVDREMHKKASYIESKTGNEKGYKSEIMGVSLKDDPNKARGKRAKLILWEEMGKFPGLLHAWNVALPSVGQGRSTFGLMVAFGTGGTEGANFAGAQELFYNPEGYNIRPVKNMWELGRESTTCGWFVPEYYNREGCYDDDGNSDIKKALEEVYIDRKNRIDNTSDPFAIVIEKAERPCNPDEAIMRTEGTVFPVHKLKEQLATIESEPAKWIDTIDVGKVVPKDGNMTWEYTEEQPVRQFPMKDNKFKQGAIEIFEHPQEYSKGGIPFGLYIAGCDPYDDDESLTNSLGSVFILNTLTDRIVAEYTGRPDTAKEFYEKVWRLCKYYNAILNYENNKKGLYAYFEQKNALYMLADNPKILKDMEMQKSFGGGNKAKGTNATLQVNRWARELIKTYLIQPAYNKEDEENYQVLRSIAALNEMILWNNDGNFDRVSALGMLMILREDRWRHKASEMVVKVKQISDDSFFSRHIEPDPLTYFSYNNLIKRIN